MEKAANLDVKITDRMIAVARAYGVVLQVVEEKNLAIDTPSMEDLLQAMETTIAEEIIGQLRTQE